MGVTKTPAYESEKYFSLDQIKVGLRTRAVKGAGTTVASQILNNVIQMAGTVVLARLLTPDDFGLVAMATSLYVIFRICRNFGLIDATVQREEISHAQISTLFWINVAFSASLTLIFIALGPALAWFYHEPKLSLIAAIISLDFILGGISAQHRALLKRNMLFYQLSANEIVAQTVSTVLAIALAFKGFGYWALAFKYVLYALSETIGAWILCSWRPGLPSRGTGVRGMLNFGVDMLKNFTLNYFSQNFDKVMVGWRSGSTPLGHYNRAYHLFLAPAQQLSVPLVNVAVATLSRVVNEPAKYRRYFLKALSMIAFVGMPSSVALTILGADVIRLLLGDQWGIAAKIFSVLSLGIGVQILYGTHCWLHISQGRADRWFRWNMMATGTTLLFILLGVPFGPIGVAAGYTASLYILLVPGIWYAGRLMDIKISSIVSAIWRYYLSAFAAAAVSWFITHRLGSTVIFFDRLSVPVRLVVGSALCLCLYLAAILLLFRGLGPVKELISVSREMVPRFREKFSGK